MRALERFWTGCHNCRGGEGCAVAEAVARAELAAASAGRSGAGESRDVRLLRLPLSVTAGAVFLLPLGLAIAAAGIAERSLGAGEGEPAVLVPVAAGLAGFFLGVGLAWLLLIAAGRRKADPAGAAECQTASRGLAAAELECQMMAHDHLGAPGAEQP